MTTKARPINAGWIHRAVSADGTEIGGRVVGRGPHLVREVDGAWHMGAWVQPEAVSAELIRFFEDRLSAA